MKTEWVTQPFDIDTAKKIQNGEIEGRIVTRDGKRVRVICWDKKCQTPIVALIDCGDEAECTEHYYNNGASLHKLDEENNGDIFLEIPEYLTFKDGDVIVFGGEYTFIGIFKRAWYHNNSHSDYVVLTNKDVLRFDGDAWVFTNSRLATEFEKQKLIEALKESTDERAKDCLKILGIETSPKLSNSLKIGKNLKLKDDLENKAANDYMDEDIISGPRGSFRKGFDCGWTTALRFARDLIKNSHSLPAEYSKLVDEHFDELI